MNARTTGYLGEQEFIRRLQQHNAEFEYIDEWCDFMIHGQPVDVKSSRLSHKFKDRTHKEGSYKIGRFDFTEEQREKELWVAFFVRHGDEFLFLGISKMKKDTPRYISIHKVRDLDLLTIDEFLNEVKQIEN